MISMALLELLWQAHWQARGGTLTSLAAIASPTQPGRVRLAEGLDRPDLPAYADATPVPLGAPDEDHLGITLVATSLRAAGLQLERLRYNAGRFTLQGVTVNIFGCGEGEGDASQRPPHTPHHAGPTTGAPGDSIGAVGGSTGSVCAPVRVDGAWTHLLSCAHVLAPRVMATQGLPPATYMPGPADAVWSTSDLETVRVGRLDRYLRGYDPQGHPISDVALARSDRPLSGPALVPGAGPLRRVAEPRVGEQVRLRGRTTPDGRGAILADTCLVHVEGCLARSFVRATYGSQLGDSGGLVYQTSGDGVVGLGMHVGRERDHAYFLPLQRSLNALCTHGLDPRTGVTPTRLTTYSFV